MSLPDLAARPGVLRLEDRLPGIVAMFGISLCFTAA
jgi:hypothetical protein